MEAVFLDLHIHTSDNPNSLNQDYDINTLLTKIRDFTGNSDFLISFTDHNTINKCVYLAAKAKSVNIILGCELHIEYAASESPYHCHIFFNASEITSQLIDEINNKLDHLYPNKVVKSGDDIPHIDAIIQTFDDYDFLLLPHGGQSHSTFDCAIPDQIKFDSVMERSIYYNQFDGFTARSNKGLEKTIQYFEKLGINEFVNLVTSTDNYKAHEYPGAKNTEAQKRNEGRS